MIPAAPSSWVCPKGSYSHRSQRELYNQPVWSSLYKAILQALPCAVQSLLGSRPCLSPELHPRWAPSPLSFNHTSSLLSLEYTTCPLISGPLYVPFLPLPPIFTWLSSQYSGPNTRTSQSLPSPAKATLSVPLEHADQCSLFHNTYQNLTLSSSFTFGYMFIFCFFSET